jgi:multisubunit Na+/H+ antiporter MnhF subunit
MISLALVLLSVGAAAFMFRILSGPSVPDRVVALDGLLSIVVIGIIAAAARSDSGISLSTVLVVALVGFVGTTALARFVERRGG